MLTTPTTYVSHMRAQFFDESEQPIHTVDGQFIALERDYIVCDGTYVAVWNKWLQRWLPKACLETAIRVVFTYVDENQRTLPDN